MDIARSLELFGMETSEQKVFMALGKNWLTVVQLARICDIKRPNIYRILEVLTVKGFIETRLDDKTTYYRAADPTVLEVLVKEQEHKAHDMRESISQIKDHLQKIGSDSSETHVHYYRGIRSLQYMLLKMHSQPKTDIYIFGTDDWGKFVSKEFSEEQRTQLVLTNSSIFELLNPEDITPIPKDGTVDFTTNKEYVLKHFKHRRISKKALTIDKEIAVYNNFIQFYSFTKNDITGIEIENEPYAQILKQLFKIAWDSAEKIDDFG